VIFHSLPVRIPKFIEQLACLASVAHFHVYYISADVSLNVKRDTLPVKHDKVLPNHRRSFSLTCRQLQTTLFQREDVVSFPVQGVLDLFYFKFEKIMLDHALLFPVFQEQR